MKIGVATNLDKDKDLKVTLQIAEILKRENIEFELECNNREICSWADMLIVVGGDGTILRVAQDAVLYDIPILGINLGRLGFLADIEASEIDKLLTKENLVKAKIEERMMLNTTVTNALMKYEYLALNETSLIRSFSSRITEFEISVNKKVVDIYPADGILISTATGSTAYNLSAGGPIVVPEADNIILTPICPHTIYSRSIVLTNKDEVSIRLPDQEELSLCIDGVVKMSINKNDTIEICKASKRVKLLKLSDRDFFEVLSKKIFKKDDNNGEERRTTI
ncbi:NAD(+)/NADH kinase [Candidatus Epulonipiscium viviparus]|uniref:NAD(+)/NADH kinase n=1 Tax=Candidatus Epulonipiscium viviparus TaxID=420336 RepID=UPI00016C0D7D|nr:NAD(+)/NADH kinase [Candidatus Epulopiscium viviparus]